MCGIVGCITRDMDKVSLSGGVVIEALQRLEYRGYDSFGLVASGDILDVWKDVGALSKAEERRSSPPSGPVVLGHTRWATHGGVSQQNAHPHVSFDGQVAIVHNGVIQNYHDLRIELQAAGVELVSETDSETAAHLIALRMRDYGDDMFTAFLRVIERLEGEYALAAVSLTRPDVLYVAKRKSPVALAAGADHVFAVSDPLAVVGKADSLVYLEDGDVATVDRDGWSVYSRSSGNWASVERVVEPFELVEEGTDLGAFDHYMLKEMYDIPEAIRAALDVPVDELADEITLAAQRGGRVFVVGAGSSFYVAAMACYLGTPCGLRIDALQSDEALSLRTFSPQDLVVVLSQSGETFDTLEVLRGALQAGARTASICNVAGATQERLADVVVRQRAGTEICVLSTKSVISQLTILHRAFNRAGFIHAAQVPEGLDALSDAVDSFLRVAADDVKALALEVAHVEHWFFVGRGVLYPAAQESALKFKEVSYQHAEGASAGMFKHGSISLIDASFYTVAFVPPQSTDPEGYDATLATLHEIAARGGPVFAIGAELGAAGDELLSGRIATPPTTTPFADLVLQLVAGQLLAYHCAVVLGRDVDRPRSLAKSVTVR